MFPAPRIFDRGRLMAALVLVAPIATMVPVLGTPGHGPAVRWAAVPLAANPLAATATPADVLANLTNPTVVGDDAQAASGTDAPAAPEAPAATATPATSQEIGSDDVAAPAPGTSDPSELGGILAASQGAATTAPVAPPSARLPVATPSIAAFPVPDAATHIFPVAGGAQFTNDWGAERADGATHKGIDLHALSGTPVLAVSDGELLKVGWNANGGWRLWLRDRWGNTFYYAHLSAYAPAAHDGAKVNAGTVVGFVGNTGDAPAATPMLHFEVHPDGGDAVPPYPYVTAWPRL